MRIIPVIDVLAGRVVHAVGGQRHLYQPIRSRLADSDDPVTIAARLLEVTGAAELYVADLDAIRDPAADSDLAVRLTDALPDADLWIDVGVRTRADLRKLPGRATGRVVTPVIGTETVTAADGWQAVADEFAPLVALSVDLFDGQWLGRPEAWEEFGLGDEPTVEDVIEAGLAATGAAYLILLDLSRVGRGRGVGTERWVRAAKRIAGANVEVVAGGGVRGHDDLKRLADAGADAALVASALHDGRLP